MAVTNIMLDRLSQRTTAGTISANMSNAAVIDPTVLAVLLAELDAYFNHVMWWKSIGEIVRFQPINTAATPAQTQAYATYLANNSLQVGNGFTLQDVSIVTAYQATALRDANRLANGTIKLMLNGTTFKTVTMPNEALLTYITRLPVGMSKVFGGLIDEVVGIMTRSQLPAFNASWNASRKKILNRIINGDLRNAIAALDGLQISENNQVQNGESIRQARLVAEADATDVCAALYPNLYSIILGESIIGVGLPDA